LITHQKTQRGRLLLLAYCAAALALFARPARANVVADFNGDGVVDQVSLPRAPASGLIVRVSGASPQTLALPGRILSIVAVDINQDGHVDLGVVSERRGLLLWINKGGRGHFKRVKKRAATETLSMSRPGPLASADEQRAAEPAAPPTQDDLSRLAEIATGHDLPRPGSGFLARPPVATPRPTTVSNTTPTRAPPVHASRLPV
jgi:hypothetical protein